MYNEISTKNLNLFKITSISIKIFLNKLMAILAVTLFINIPVRVISLLITTYVLDLDKHFIIGLFFPIIESFVILLSTMSIILITTAEINANNLEISTIFKKAFEIWGRAITTSVLEGIIIILLSFLLIVPGIIWMVYYAFSKQVVTLKNVAGKKALDYSKFLVKGRWWKIFGVLFLYGLIYYLIFRIINIPKNSFGSINELALLVIPLREIMNSFFVVITSILFLNIDSLFGKENADELERTTAVDYFVSKTGSQIDDCEEECEYDFESEKCKCPECGISLIESDIICPACRMEIRKEPK